MSRRSSEARCPHCRYAHHEGACFLPDGSDAWSYGYDAGRLAAIRADVERHVEQGERRLARYVTSMAEYERAHPERFMGKDPITHLAALLESGEYAKLSGEVDDCRRWLEEAR